MGSASPSTRKHSDFTKLMMAGYEVDMPSGSTQDFFVKFKAPEDTLYAGGIFRVHVELPDDYPFRSPSIGFSNRVFHPNIDERSGTVCLDVINQTWTPLYSLVNIFDVFLPQLLTYPNASDPLNSEAAALFMKDKQKYNEKIKEYIRLYASDSSIFSSSTTLVSPKNTRVRRQEGLASSSQSEVTSGPEALPSGEELSLKEQMELDLSDVSDIEEQVEMDVTVVDYSTPVKKGNDDDIDALF